MLNDNYIELLLDVKGAKVTKFEEKLDVFRIWISLERKVLGCPVCQARLRQAGEVG